MRTHFPTFHIILSCLKRKTSLLPNHKKFQRNVAFCNPILINFFKSENLVTT